MAKFTIPGAIVCACLFVSSPAQAAVTATVANGSLTVSGDAGDDTITITCAGNVLVNGADPATGPQPCLGVSEIIVYAAEGNDTVDLTALKASAFAAHPAITVDAGPGDDTVNGSVFSEVLLGGPGNDRLNGNFGNDDIDAGEGNDVALGNEGDDTLRWSAGATPHHMDGGSGNDRVLVSGSDLADVVDVFWDNKIAMDGEIHYNVVVNGVTLRSSTVETFDIALGAGDDVVHAYPLALTALVLHGGDGNNTLGLDSRCADGTLLADSYTQAAVQTATFDGFAAVDVANRYTFRLSQVDVAADATTASVDLDAGESCAWTATSDASWLAITNGGTGPGPATIALSLTPNTSTEPRTGHVSVNGSSVAIVQAGVKAEAQPSGNAPATGNGTPLDEDNGGTGAPEAPAAATKGGCAAAQPNAFAFLALSTLAFLRRRARR